MTVLPLDSRVFGLALVVFLVLFSRGVWAGDLDGAYAKPVQVRLPQLLAVSNPLSLDCPILPACPGCETIPLPPLLESPPKSKRSSPKTEVGNVTLGRGKYEGMVLIPAGSFDMGSEENLGRVDERPVRRVHLKDFYIAKHEVTVREYCDFLNAKGNASRDGTLRVQVDNPHCPLAKDGAYFQPKPDMEEKPIVCVSWYGAADFAEWAGGRLPTSAEWEKAALFTSPYRPEDFLTLLTRADSVPVSIAPPGASGVTGMLGNVWEWCSDWYARDDYAQLAGGVNPTGPPLGREKVIRGGSWASPEASKRIRNRHKASPRGYFRTVGFRIVKD
ncbi:MAG: SUMF1/EgtB/PvdO family nonheme iron enzyme [Desulfomonilaceae bacterium]|nr:SUMF1/EgtB/PvdO family nonheme iron enzyme [Desulfomonilaceae bacterium]